MIFSRSSKRAVEPLFLVGPVHWFFFSKVDQVAFLRYGVDLDILDPIVQVWRKGNERKKLLTIFVFAIKMII
jgi:hypothetical protein